MMEGTKTKEVLVIDDEPRVRSLLSESLRKRGYPVFEAYSCERIVESLRSHSDIGAVILDIRLPECNGMEIFEFIRKEFPRVKIIVSSVYPKEEQEFLIDSADGYFYKTEGVFPLLELIDRLL